MEDRQTISKWFYDYSNDVYNFLVYYQGGTLDVEDLVQEVFIRAARGLASFRNDARPKTWLFSIARHVAIDHARKKTRTGESTSVPFEERYADGYHQGPENVLLEGEGMQELYASIMKLKRSYRDVLILRGIESMSVAETAEILDWKEPKVKTTYYRAKKALRKQLSEEGGVDYGA